MNKETLKRLICEGKIGEIFKQHLGWDGTNTPPVLLETQFAGEEYSLSAAPVAHKRGFVVCDAQCDEIPPRAVRQKLQRKMKRTYYEHLLVLRDGEGKQIWMAAVRHPEKPASFIEVPLAKGQEPELVLQKIRAVVFSLAEEGDLVITDVVEKVQKAFAKHAKEITKEFYKRFRDELDKFTGFINGLQQHVDREQYAALMLNRLMFVYFIQSKEFLDGDARYLQNRLDAHLRKTEELRAANPEKPAASFYKSFYRHFLMTLFHRGLGAPQESRDAEVQSQIGKVPYLNGGLFDTHELERQYCDNLDIEDAAFKKIFAFFDEWRWHLDDRETASGKDINPDVIGYIFEKYINARANPNARAEMGAYYTREDITGYIARNTVLPHLLRRAKENCREAFHPQTGTIWKLLRENPDDYIRAAVRKGGDLHDSELPENIRIGLDANAPDLLKRRAKWNTAAAEKWALPTETWREAMTRRARYFALKQKLQSGGVSDIADLTTDNLDIERLTLDTLGKHEGADFISAFYAAVAGRAQMENSNAKERRGVSVLDPACGSGAFLFAALNVLEPLYAECIKRMREFVDEDDVLRENGKRKGAKKHPEFRRVLDEMKTHASEEYWIYRSIILNNLFGVDIMPEAAEVAKLRLFLKLAAAAEKDDSKPNMGLEPLPDIDFNIRAGNALVGFANAEDFRKMAGAVLDLEGGAKKINIQLGEVGTAYRRFVDSQTVADINTLEFKAAKTKLESELGQLNAQLDRYLASSYEIPMQETELPSDRLNDWRESHRPFHWLSEFHDIIAEGGFDVVIGNPPYVNAKTINYQTLGFPNYSDIYAHITDRSIDLLADGGTAGLVVMSSISYNNKFHPLLDKIEKECSEGWLSFYAPIPQGLFPGVRVQNCIMLAEKRRTRKRQFRTTRLQRWNAEARNELFANLSYTPCRIKAGIPRINSVLLSNLWERDSHKRILGFYAAEGGWENQVLYFRGVAYNFISVSPKAPPSYNAKMQNVAGSGMLIFKEEARDAAMLFLAGRFYFSCWLTYGDNYHLTQSNIFNAKFPDLSRIGSRDSAALRGIYARWCEQLESVLQFKLNHGVKAGAYNTSKLWHITDESDLIFLKYMTEKPEQVLDEILTHVVQTVKTPLNIKTDE